LTQFPSGLKIEVYGGIYDRIYTWNSSLLCLADLSNFERDCNMGFYNNYQAVIKFLFEMVIKYSEIDRRNFISGFKKAAEQSLTQDQYNLFLLAIEENND
jgi:hypothetical protein